MLNNRDRRKAISPVPFLQENNMGFLKTVSDKFEDKSIRLFSSWCWIKSDFADDFEYLQDNDVNFISVSKNITKDLLLNLLKKNLNLLRYLIISI